MTTRMVIFAAIVTAGPAVGRVDLLEAVPRGAADGFRVDLGLLTSAEVEAAAIRDADIPRAFRGLDGKKVVVEGFRTRLDSLGAEPARHFKLIYTTTGSKWDRNDPRRRVDCTAAANVVVTDDPATLCVATGVPHVGVQRDPEHRLVSIYRMDVDTLEPVR